LTRYLARQKHDWKLCSHVLAELMNGPRQRKDKRPWLPHQLDPYAERVETTAEKVTPSELVQKALSSLL
jgi:hypothetical protein